MDTPKIRSGDLLRIVTPDWETVAIVSDVTVLEDGRQTISTIPDPSAGVAVQED